MREFDIGSSIPRVEDLTLLRGRGRYTDDISMPGEARLFVLRAPHASARIKRIDTAAAKTAPGVIAVYTGADLAADGIGDVPSRGRKKTPDGKPNFEPPYPALIRDRVAMLGDPVVAVIAETLAQAKDAAELVEIDYEPLPAVTDTAATVAPGAPAVWPQAPGNVCYVERDRQQGRRSTPPSPRPSTSSGSASSSRASACIRWSRAPRSAITTSARPATRCNPACRCRTASARSWPTSSSSCRRPASA